MIKHAPGHSKWQIIISNHDPEFQRWQGEGWTGGWQPQKNTLVTNKIKLDYVKCFLMFLLFQGFGNIWVEANSELFLGWGSWSCTRVTDRRKSQISFFQLKLVILCNSSLKATMISRLQTPFKPHSRSFSGSYSKNHDWKTVSKKASKLSRRLSRKDRYRSQSSFLDLSSRTAWKFCLECFPTQWDSDTVQAELGTASSWKPWAAGAEQDTEHSLT